MNGSPAFHAALEAIVDADAYMAVLEEDAKANPAIDEGMTVGVYGGTYGDEFKGYGRIVDKPRWCKAERQYLAAVLMYEGSIRYDVRSTDMVRGHWSGFKMSLGMLRLASFSPWIPARRNEPGEAKSPRQQIGADVRAP